MKQKRRDAQLLSQQLLLLLAVTICASNALHLRGGFESQEIFQLLAQFGFEKTKKPDRINTPDYISGSVTSDSKLIVVPRSMNHHSISKRKAVFLPEKSKIIAAVPVDTRAHPSTILPTKTTSSEHWSTSSVYEETAWASSGNASEILDHQDSTNTPAIYFAAVPRHSEQRL